MDGQKITTPCGKRPGKLPGKIRVPGTRKISEIVKRVSGILSQTLRASPAHYHHYLPLIIYCENAAKSSELRQNHKCWN